MPHLESFRLLWIAILLYFAKGGQALDYDFPCANELWTYNALSGKCYSTTFDEKRYTPMEAVTMCKGMLQEYPEVNVTIVEIRSRDDMLALKDYLVGNSLKERVLLNARRVNGSEPFRWQSDEQLVDLDFMIWSEGAGDGNCLVVFYTSERFNTGWKTVIAVEEDLCTTEYSIVCEHLVKSCDKPPAEFDVETMRFYPTQPFVGSTTEVYCSPGFSPQANNSTDSHDFHSDLALTLPLGELKCRGKRDPSGDPEKYQASFQVKQEIRSTCVAIHCNATQMHEMTPKNASLASARNRLNEEEFGPLQVEKFNQYGNVVTYRCLDGLFFTDRTFEKYVECALMDGYDNVGEWRGYGGTSLPLPDSCISVTCMYEDALPKSTYNLKEEFKMRYVNGSSDIKTKLEPIFYPHLTSIEYDCKEGYQTVTSTASQNITCGHLGRWIPQLTGCLKIFSGINTSSSGRYQPPIVEAPSARQLGSLLIGIICIFLLALLFLDVATLRRDSAWFLNNIRLQRRLWKAKRRFRRERKEALARKAL